MPLVLELEELGIVVELLAFVASTVVAVMDSSLAYSLIAQERDGALILQQR